jgi:hypothetical protein
LFELRTLPEGEFLEIPGQRRSPREQRRRGRGPELASGARDGGELVVVVDVELLQRDAVANLLGEGFQIVARQRQSRELCG